MSAQPPPTTVRGIDIGTGASCIYALLGATMNKWQWIATEVDAESFRIAKENVQRNGLGHLIDVRHVPVGSFLVGNIKPEDGPIEFCVCNPPFFSTLEEVWHCVLASLVCVTSVCARGSVHIRAHLPLLARRP